MSEPLIVTAPGPLTPVRISVLKGVGSQPIKIKYFKDTQIDFATGSSPGPWSALITVFNPDGTVNFSLTSPSRVTLGSSGYNVQFQFSAADFVNVAVGYYTYNVVLIPTVGVPLLILYGNVSVENTPTSE